MLGLLHGAPVVVGSDPCLLYEPVLSQQGALLFLRVTSSSGRLLSVAEKAVSRKRYPVPRGRGTYVGPIRELEGATAELLVDHGTLRAQFDDRKLVLPPSVARQCEELDPDVEFAHQRGFLVYLGFDWHRFHRSHFNIERAPREAY